MLAIINDLERIGDLFYQISIGIDQKNDSESWFTPDQVENLRLMLQKLDEAFEILKHNILIEPNKVDLDPDITKEKEINKLRDRL